LREVRIGVGQTSVESVVKQMYQDQQLSDQELEYLEREYFGYYLEDYFQRSLLNDTFHTPLQLPYKSMLARPISNIEDLIKYTKEKFKERMERVLVEYKYDGERV
jgi:ATP-dependent DNA ligase